MHDLYFGREMQWPEMVSATAKDNERFVMKAYSSSRI